MVSIARGRSDSRPDGVRNLINSFMQANAIGRSSKTVREFLEKNHKDDMTREETIKLTVKSLLEVVQTGAKNIEISVMTGFGQVEVSIFCSDSHILIIQIMMQSLDLSQIETIVSEIEREKEAGMVFSRSIDEEVH